MISCKECGKCTDDSLRKFCFKENDRNELINLIADAIKDQFETYEFLYNNDVKLNSNMKNCVIGGVTMHFNCLLPNIDEKR